MRPIAAAGLGALISGLAFYAVGTRAAQTSGMVEMPAIVQTVDGRFIRVPGAETMAYPQQMGYVQTPGMVGQPMAAPMLVSQSSAPAPARTRTVYRTAPAQERVVERRTEPTRSVAKTALIIGGSAASGAGVGALIGGKKGALAGAAIGGGAASIYEATKRR